MNKSSYLSYIHCRKKAHPFCNVWFVAKCYQTIRWTLPFLWLYTASMEI